MKRDKIHPTKMTRGCDLICKGSRDLRYAEHKHDAL